MIIDKVTNGSTLEVKINGRIDTMTAPELENALKDKLAGIEELIIDLKDVEYISSAGLRVLITNHKAMMKQGRLVIRNVSDEIMEIFELTGFIDILNIE